MNKTLSNRANAQKSTGPKTKAGKMAVSKNSLKHGILSKRAVLDCENKQEYEAFRERMNKSLAPEGELEVLLVDRIVTTAWRLQRVTRIETEHIDNYLNDVLALGNTLGSTMRSCNDVFSNILKYETSIERSLFKALHELQRLQATRQGQHVVQPVSIDIQAQGISES